MTQNELFQALKPRLIQKGFDAKRVEAFISWNNKNPWVWPAIIKRFNELVQLGNKSLGMKKIFEDIRSMPRPYSTGKYGLSNSWTCLYGHSLVIVFPQAKNILRLESVKPNARFYLSKQAA